MLAPNVHKGKLRFRKGKGLAQGHRVISAKLVQSHGPSAPGPPAQQGGVPKGNSPPLPAPHPLPRGNVLWQLPPPLSLWHCHRRLSFPQAALYPPDQAGRGRASKDYPRHCHCLPTWPALPSGCSSHLDLFHALLGGLGRHTLDLWLEPLPAEGHSHVSTFLDLGRGQHTPAQVVGQPCVGVSM